MPSDACQQQPDQNQRCTTTSPPPLPPPFPCCRYLGLHLAEIKARSEDSWFGKHGKFAWMNKTQLCPIIWILILGLLLIFVTKVGPFTFGDGEGA
jgi:hypothetical protein